MKLSHRWLSRHVDLTGIEPKQILADLTMSTAEIEGLHRFGDCLEPLVVGHVRKRDKHPDADKLSVCQVDLGDAGGVLQIVCGAPNVQAGQRVVVIKPGDTLPAGGGKGALKIKVGKIRGVESHGMICSESELGLSEEHDGILVLPPDTPIGARFIDVLPVQDWVFEIDNKSVNHRPDLWGHYGFARELAAIYGRELRPVVVPAPLPSPAQPGGKQVEVRIDDRTGCPRYCGLVIDGVTAGPSPLELRWQLAAVGQRAINLPVDLTNFVMLDLGQPMHAFDAAHVGKGPIRVRRAKAGEKITTLDGQTRTLDGEDLLICSGDTPEALAGIMGGAGTMVAPTTTSLFLESANFHAAAIRRTSMRLALRTDASARFEKAQDPANAELAVHHFLHLLQQYCPTAAAAGPLVDPAGFRYEPKHVTLRRTRLAQKLGITLEDEQVAGILRSLQFTVTVTTTGFDCGVPSFRATKDIHIEDDLIEEVGRMFRYDNIPERPLYGTVAPPPRNEELFLVRRLLEVACLELGCSEAYNYSFVPDAVLTGCDALGHAYVRVANPVAPEITRMRRHVLPSLLASAANNLRQHNELRLCEHGKGYHPEMPDDHKLPHEVRELALVFARRDGPHPFGELREALRTLLQRLGYPVEMQRVWHGKDQPWVHPNRAVALDRDGSPVGYLAHLHPGIARSMNLPLTTAIACIDVRALHANGRRIARYQAVPTFPVLPVDVALLVDESTQVAAAAEFLRTVGRKLVRDVSLFEVYRGERLPAGKKSLNFTVTLGADDRTLTDEDEGKYLGKVREQAASIGAEMRG
ncbi:MAG: phenylalanine--tRNA ligase subunit beta [Planctomycetes bacterium]|nr:phenylalanine--tRNA ligase subunit beta [Planctomycetota bacterium]MCC7396208.1 phenylalanine--tRNA ligase subunit beta [Planctomycetota bacterium]